MSEKLELPPGYRGVAAQRLASAAAQGHFELPVCDDCGTVQYPPRERCVNCLSDHLTWKGVAPLGTLLARTTIHHSNEPYFGSQLPIAMGSVKLDAGPVAIVFVRDKGLEAGARVRIEIGLDVSGHAVFSAASDADGV